MLGGGGERRVLVDGHTADLYGVARSAASAELFATACDSSRLKLWDAVARRALCEVPVGAAARCVAFSADGVWLAAGLVDGTVEVLRVGGGGAAVAASRVTRLREGDREVSALGFSPDGGTLAVGTAEGVVGLFDTATWRRLARCTGHATTVAHVDWSRDSSTVQTNCRGYEILYWEGRSGRQLLGAHRDWEAWEGWSCVLGWPVMGIWRDGYDGTDINAVHASDDGRLLVAADDRGGVLLFRFPCAARRAPCRRFRAHSSHVMNVRWLAGGDRCVSVGGRDRAVVQWRLAREPK
jgi:microtubule-associated protein-like 6